MAETTAFGPLSGQLETASGLQVVNEVLTTVARQFKPHGYVYDQLVAPQLVNRKLGLFPVFNPAQFFAAAGNISVADRAQTPEINFEWSTEPFHCKPYRLQTIITREEANQAHPALRLDYSKTIGLLTVFATNREVRLAERLRTETNGGQLLNGGKPAVQWDKGDTTVKVQEDLQKAALKIYKASGIKPNTLVITQSMAYALANDPTLKEIIKYQIGPQFIRDGQSALLPDTLFGLKVVIAEGVLYNQARPEDKASLTDVWGNSARLMYCDPNAQWGIPSTVYSFRSPVTEGDHQPPATIMPQAGNEPGPAGSWAIVDQWWDYDPPALHIRAWESVDERVVAPSLGYELEEVLANP